MNITISVDEAGIRKQLGEFAKQAPFACALGITRTLQDIQRAEQGNMSKVFQLRNTEAFFRRSVKITSATKTTLTGNVRVEGPQSGAISAADRVSKAILRHEEGGTQRSSAVYRGTNGAVIGGFYIPAKGLRTAGANPPRALYPSAIGAQLRSDPSGRKFFADSQKGRKRQRGQEGRERSYFATAKGIFERRHFGSLSAVRPLWIFSRTIKLRPRLRFRAIGQEVADKHLTPNLTRAMDDAIASAFK